MLLSAVFSPTLYESPAISICADFSQVMQPSTLTSTKADQIPFSIEPPATTEPLLKVMGLLRTGPLPPLTSPVTISQGSLQIFPSSSEVIK